MYSVLKRLIILCLLLQPLILSAQTDTVQTFTFFDSTRRSGKFLFPPAGENYRKVLMLYTLKCYPKVSAYDKKYPCGEWDYLTYTFVTDTAGKQVEIGRYITPYGINLSLGPNGFTWVYDVTDYQQYLKDSVKLSAGNTQELLDLKFVFFKGVPPAEVVKVHQLWNPGVASYSYADLSADKRMAPLAVKPELGRSSILKYRSRITGHGHNSNDGKYPHCCEWKDNTHYLYSGDSLVHSWSIWQTLDCADNPVFPQGGTWPYAREGWCPGDRVKDTEFDVTRFLGQAGDDSIRLDYRITPVPANNAGMGGGNYIMANHLIEYRYPTHRNDAEIYDILNPNKSQITGKFNPSCTEPSIVLRNNSYDTMYMVELEYYVRFGIRLKYTWTGRLGFLQTETVRLPIPDGGFYRGDGSNLFTCSILRRNGLKDDYSANNSLTVGFKLPDVFKDKIYIEFKTNTNPTENRMVVRNSKDQEVVIRQNLKANTVYRDTLTKLPPGCYTMELTDEQTDGLSFWANNAQGSGYIRFMNVATKKVLKTFGSDFGYRIYYAFIIDSLQKAGQPEEVDIDGDEDVLIYPNPGKGGFTIETYGFSGTWDLEIYNTLGQLVYTGSYQTSDQPTLEIRDTGLSAGLYVVRLSNGKQTLTRKWMSE